MWKIDIEYKDSYVEQGSFKTLEDAVIYFLFKINIDYPNCKSVKFEEVT